MIATLGGSDYVDGLHGNDLLCGGGGIDLIMGRQGGDRIDGGADRDFLIGGPGSDRLDGGYGNDQLKGKLGSDRCFGGHPFTEGVGGWDPSGPNLTSSDVADHRTCERIHSAYGIHLRIDNGEGCGSPGGTHSATGITPPA